jgi:Icc protein
MITSDQNIRYQQNLTGRKLAFVVLGSNIWPVVRDHGAAIAARVEAATPGSCAFIEMPLPPKHSIESVVRFLQRKIRQLAYPFPLIAALLFALLRTGASTDVPPFRFVILGDRTGEAAAGVYEQAWREAAAELPAFVITVGDTIEGSLDATAPAEWQQAERILQPYKRYPIYLTPGNHDIWSAVSERLFREHSAHPPHYSFDYRQAHFTILDNSRSDEFSAGEMDFLQKDLQAHAAQPVKFIFSHRPSWLIDVALQKPDFALHQLARQYGVQYVVAGHIHQLLRFQLQGVTYLSMPSSGGHLRASREYAEGWFFAHALVNVRGTDIDFHIEELKPPHGQGRVTVSTDWGMAGLVDRNAGKR